jgi:beta-glucanase (GH16 family)
MLVGVFSIAVLFSASCNNKVSQPNSKEVEHPWKLAFEDDFNGTNIDTVNWDLYNSPGNGGFGLRRPSAISASDGSLVITAQMKNGDLVSEGIANKKNYTYGKFVFRVRTEKDPSEATSGVVLTWPESGHWPMDGENDMYETGTDSSRAHFNTFIHYGTSPHTQYQFTHHVDATRWHTVSMIWEPDSIQIYTDSALVWTLRDSAAIPDVPHHLCIQLDAFKDTMEAPVHMYVDWVKIYQ